MWYIMNWKTFTGWAIGYMIGGALIGWTAAKWCEAYQEARDAGVVA